MKNNNLENMTVTSGPSTAAVNGTALTATKRGRGRPKGSKNKPKTATTVTATSTVA
jgi:hypothetical protein